MSTARLPRGRHGLSRDEVVSSQRTRILLAVAEGMAEKGFVATSVADVLRRAGVSRETFYQQFTSKADAFSAAFDAAAELLFGQVLAGLGATNATPSAPPTSPPTTDGAGPDAGGRIEGLDLAALGGTPFERFDAVFTGYLDALAGEPAYARLFLVEVYAAGPEAIVRRAELQGQIVDALVALLDSARSERARFACEVLVAATASLVTVPLVTGDLDALRALRSPVLDLVRTALATAEP